MTDSTSRSSAEHHQLRFVDRHIGPDADAVATMLGVIGVDSLEELAAKALPAESKDLTLAQCHELLGNLQEAADHRSEV